ncbi:MAG: GNAT family N-acetyltransferase [Bacilli bacterium]|nr:GNAT family N-acetyltransferase [Bacilli bacterium]
MEFIGTKIINTERLTLRPLVVNDAYKAYENWCSSDDVAKYVTWNKHTDVNFTLNLYTALVQDYEDPRTFRWIVEEKSTGDLVGMIDVSKKYLDYGTCGIGYCYGKKFWNKGYGTETLKAVIQFLFVDASADVVCAEYLSNNPASGRVMEKAGMKYDGTLRSRVIDKDNIRNDLLCYSITKEEYFS